MEIPDKFYFKISEVSSITGLPGYVLRFWESEFKTVCPARSESGQRLYRKADIEKILTIKHLLYDRKFTIPGAKKYLKSRNAQTCAPSGQNIIEKIREELQAIRDLLE